MNDIITGNRLRVLAFGVNTGTLETTLLYPMTGDNLMLQRPDPKCQDNYSIGTRVSDIREAMAEIERLRAELATILLWSQTMYNMLPGMTTIDDELAYTLTKMQDAAPKIVRQGGESSD